MCLLLNRFIIPFRHFILAHSSFSVTVQKQNRFTLIAGTNAYSLHHNFCQWPDTTQTPSVAETGHRVVQHTGQLVWRVAHLAQNCSLAASLLWWQSWWWWMASRFEEQKPYLVKSQSWGQWKWGNFGRDLFKEDHVAVEKGFVLGERLAGCEVAFGGTG